MAFLASAILREQEHQEKIEAYHDELDRMYRRLGSAKTKAERKEIKTEIKIFKSRKEMLTRKRKWYE